MGLAGGAALAGQLLAACGGATPALTLAVAEGLAADARPAPLLRDTADPPQFARLLLLLGAAGLLLLAAGALLLRRRRRPAPAPPPGSDARLAALQRQLVPRLAASAPARALDLRLQQLRFGPLEVTATELDALQTQAKAFPGLVGLDLAKDVNYRQMFTWDETP